MILNYNLQKALMYTKKSDIENWLKKKKIKNYIIHDDLTVDVNGHVKLNNLHSFPVKFGIIHGDFDCSGEPGYDMIMEFFITRLTTLENGPDEVYGNFNCSANKLKSLQYSPKIVTGDFISYNNLLINLNGCTKEIIGTFNCCGNKLSSLDGGPTKVNGDYHCEYNQINYLTYCPEIVGGNFYCSDNYIVDISDLSSVINGLFIHECNSEHYQIKSFKQYYTTQYFVDDTLYSFIIPGSELLKINI